MSTPSPVLADAFRMLSDNLYAHLEEAVCLADRSGQWSTEDIQTARKLIGDLVLVIHGLLIEHERQNNGECRICTSPWPCPVVTTVHAVVKDPERQFAALLERAQEEMPIGYGGARR